CAPAKCRSWRAFTASFITRAVSRPNCATRCSVAARRSRATTASPGCMTGCEGVAGLLRLDAGILDHLRPFGELHLDEFVELVRRAGEGFEADSRDTRFHLRILDELSRFAVEQRHDLRRRAGRREQARPGLHLETGHAGFVQ